jgi:hypothetical protein
LFDEFMKELSVLPEFMGYNLLPVISVGFTFFPFN